MFRLKLEFPRLFLAQVSIIKFLSTQQIVCLIPGNLLGVLTAKRLEYCNFNRGPSKLDAPISSKQFFALKFRFE